MKLHTIGRHALVEGDSGTQTYAALGAFNQSSTVPVTATRSPGAVRSSSRARAST